MEKKTTHVPEKRVPDFFKDSWEFMAEDSQTIELEIYRCLEEGAYEDLKDLETKWEAYNLQIKMYMEKERKRFLHEQQERLCMYYAGYISALFQLEERFTRNQWEHEQIAYIRTEYFDRVMEALSEHGYLKHGKLAEILGVSPSQMHQIIDDILACPIRMINKEKNSKYVIYSLTPRGKQYLRQKTINRPPALSYSSEKLKSIDKISQEYEFKRRLRQKAAFVSSFNNTDISYHPAFNQQRKIPTSTFKYEKQFV